MRPTQRRQVTVDSIAAWFGGGRFGRGGTPPIGPAILTPTAAGGSKPLSTRLLSAI